MKSSRRSFRPFVLGELPSVAEALNRWAEAVPRLRPPVEQRELWNAFGRIVASDIVASGPIPAFSRSLMDGVAVRSSDAADASPTKPAKLALIGRVEMGRAPTFALGSGEGAIVPTGGMLPAGADAVLMVEEIRELLEATELPAPSFPRHVYVRRRVQQGENASPAGADVRPGQVVLRRGHRLRAQDVGVLAGLGRVVVPVHRKVEVALLSTGAEVVSPDEEPEPGQIRDMNAMALAALVQEAGARPRLLGIVGDEPKALQEAIEDGLQSDMLILSGGSSVGEDDWTARLLSGMGEPGIIVHGVKLAPGKPTLCALIGDRPVIGLPGNPVSALIVFRLFALPALWAISGREDVPGWRPVVKARLSEAVRGAKGRELHLRVALIPTSGEGWLAQPIRGGSSQLMTMVQADGIIVVPSDTSLAAGSRVEVHPWDMPS